MKLHKKGYRIYGVNYKDTKQDMQNFLKNFGNPFDKISVDAAGQTSIEWGVYGMPETYLVDRDGMIRARHTGPIMPRDLERTILPALEQMQ
jgi:cytochrome c biogenesis protein CcmG/thiol:disulfide interchange protein DsbE